MSGLNTYTHNKSFHLCRLLDHGKNEWKKKKRQLTKIVSRLLVSGLGPVGGGHAPGTGRLGGLGRHVVKGVAPYSELTMSRFVGSLEKAILHRFSFSFSLFLFCTFMDLSRVADFAQAKRNKLDILCEGTLNGLMIVVFMLFLLLVIASIWKKRSPLLNSKTRLLAAGSIQQLRPASWVCSMLDSLPAVAAVVRTNVPGHQNWTIS